MPIKCNWGGAGGEIYRQMGHATQVAPLVPSKMLVPGSPPKFRWLEWNPTNWRKFSTLWRVHPETRTHTHYDRWGTGPTSWEIQEGKRQIRAPEGRKPCKALSSESEEMRPGCDSIPRETESICSLPATCHKDIQERNGGADVGKRRDL